MTAQEIFDIATKSVLFHLATVEGDQPRVREMMLYKADENGIVFHTSALKDLCKQVKSNPKVELCFNYESMQVRIFGELEEILDTKFKDEITEHPSRKFLKAWKESGELEDFYKNFTVYSLKNGVASVWTKETNFVPKEYIQL